MQTQLFAGLRQDISFSLRQLRRDRVFTTVAVVTLALGIGATTTLFTVLDAVVLRPLPFPDPDRLIDIATTWQEEPGAISVGNYLVIKERARVFEAIAARSGATFNLTGGGDPERVQGAHVTASYFQVFGMSPEFGRFFTADEDAPGKARVAVLSHGLFSRRFGSDPGVIGRTIHLSGLAHEVVGVMPEAFQLPEDTIEVWTPIAFAPSSRSFDAHYLSVTARLRKDTTEARLGAERQALTLAVMEAAPRDNSGRVLVTSRLLDRIVGDYRQRLLVLLGAVTLVFLIACVNVASLLLARGAGRHREIALRAALGANRFRIARQLMTEAFLLCLLGTAAGLILAGIALPIFMARGPADLPRLAEAGLNPSALLVASALAFAATLLAGLAPALRESRAGLAEARDRPRAGRSGAFAIP